MKMAMCFMAILERKQTTGQGRPERKNVLFMSIGNEIEEKIFQEVVPKWEMRKKKIRE